LSLNCHRFGLNGDRLALNSDRLSLNCHRFGLNGDRLALNGDHLALNSHYLITPVCNFKCLTISYIKFYTKQISVLLIIAI